MKEKYKILCALILLFGVGLGIGFFLSKERVKEWVFAGVPSGQLDVVGTRGLTATSSVGVNFSVNAKVAGQSATGTYVTRIGADVDTAVYHINTILSSSTANLQMAVLLSNDSHCDTSSTTAGTGALAWLKTDITWYDAAPFIFNGATAQSFGLGTSTQILTNPKAGTGETLLLTNLVAECMRLDISGSSTKAYVQLRTKSSNN